MWVKNTAVCPISEIQTSQILNVADNGILNDPTISVDARCVSQIGLVCIQAKSEKNPEVKYSMEPALFQEPLEARNTSSHSRRGVSFPYCRTMFVPKQEHAVGGVFLCCRKRKRIVFCRCRKSSI